MLGIRSDEVEQLMDFVTEAEMKRKAVRPPYSPMRCQVSDRLGLAPMREWQSALADFLKGI
jgi:dTDP-4-dehydrorhamnose reductase